MASSFFNVPYPGFQYQANEIKRFSKAGNLFSILLKNDSIIHFETDMFDQENFHEWLKVNNVCDVKDPITSNIKKK